MKQVSIWASRHKWPARILIVLLYFLLNICGFFAGSLLQSTGVQPGIFFIDFIFIVILAAYLFYPEKASYYKRKFFDGTMLVSTFCTICFYGTQINNSSFLLPFSNSSAATTTTYTAASERAEKTLKIVPGKKLTKKEFRKQIRQALKAKDAEKTGQKIILIVLTILLAAVVLYLLLALSCSIACSGSEALAVLVLVLGAFGVVFGAIKIIQRINRGPKKKESPALP